jgi:hypothetical protein
MRIYHIFVYKKIKVTHILWITLKRIGRKKQETRCQKLQAFDVRGSLFLREEAGRRAAAAEGTAHPVRAEPDPAAAEEEEARSAAEADIGAGIIEFVAGAVHVEFLKTDKPFRMNESNTAHIQSPETEFAACKTDACPADGTTAMTKTKLGRNDENATFLAFSDLANCGDGP